ncbi:Six-hairpin glycosidase-like protein [Bombardia bombarda]|uniref:Six-hairpin glycosidase-like protein n=1 Tax=Bombardia bombarda TaxID=252184 RepID=A0AA39X8F4_9PEZI|nr:Six-hairpin glycosidase-like protein [Bombardia bombarda]
MLLSTTLHGAFCLLLAFLCQASAQTCWRNTPCSSINETAFPGVWESNIFAPSSRTIAPKSVLSLASGKVVSAYTGSQMLEKNGSAVVFDFGIEVGGIVTIKYAASGSGSGAVGLAFTESKNWIGEWSDASNGAFKGPDGALYSNFSGPGSAVYKMPEEKHRGGFRYLTLFLVAQRSSVQISGISLEIGFQPTWPNLRAYQGYFHSNDETLNAIWYSGAYTLQTNAVPPNTGRKASPMATSGWSNDGYLGPGNTIIVDGAKRDRAVWPGDMGVAVPSTFVSIGDLESVKNALQVMYDYQNADGSFPEAGPPLLQQGSDTYHMWTMIGTYNYVLYTNDTAFLNKNWARYLRAMTFINAKVQSPMGLLQVTGTRDWARWQTSGTMTQAQMILYRTLTTGAELASWVSSSSTTTNLTSTWLLAASALQNATLTHCYSPTAHLFKDNATSTTLHPQDANSLAILFSLIPPYSAQSQSISAALLANWTPSAPPRPNCRETSPPSSPPSSTVVEGYLVNGTFGYRWNRGYGNDFSYVSHAHGWSSGPTSSLTERVLGLRVTGRAGGQWAFAPQMGDLTEVEGGLLLCWASFGRTTVDVPVGTTGEFILPVVVQGKMPRVAVDGQVVNVEWYRRTDVAGDGDLVVVRDMPGGSHTIEAS